MLSKKEIYLLHQEYEDLDGWEFLTSRSFPDIGPLAIIFNTQNWIDMIDDPHIFIRNTYSNNWTDEFFVISISESPEILYSPRDWKVSPKDIARVMNFVSKYHKMLISAPMMDDEDYKEMGDVVNKPLSEDFCRRFTEIPQNGSLSPDETGLPFTIWLDPGTKRQHSNRIKILHTDGERTSVYLDTGKTEGKKLTGKEYSKVMKFIKANRVAIEKFYNSGKQIGDVKTELYSLNKKGELVEPNKPKKDYVVIDDEDYGYPGLRLVKFIDDEYQNILDLKTGDLLFKNSVGKPLRFIYIPKFQKAKNEYKSIVYTDSVYYELYIDGRCIRREYE